MRDFLFVCAASCLLAGAVVIWLDPPAAIMLAFFSIIFSGVGYHYRD